MDNNRSQDTAPASKRSLMLVFFGAMAFWAVARYRNAQKSPLRVRKLPIARAQRVAGESHYQDAIVAWMSRNSSQGYALLILEPENPYSPSGKAVRVDLAAGDDQVTCGYIPEVIAAQWYEPVYRLFQSGAWAFCDVQILSGWDTEDYLRVRIVPSCARRPKNSMQSVAIETET